MAFDQFTDRARSIVDFAREEATRLGCDRVDSVHLLLGMIREGKGVAGNVLGSMGVNSDKVLQAYEQHRDIADVTLEEFESRCLTQVAWLHHNYAGTEHCILAICSVPDCRAAKVLSEIGVPSPELCREVLCLLGHEERFDDWRDDHLRLP